MTIKIFLGNLSSETTSDKIRPLFEKYGEVVECDVLKNFGFVHMVNKSEANKAIAQLDGYSIDGKNIRVELSTGKKGAGSGGGKFDKKGFGSGSSRSRPYGPPPDPRDYDRYPYPPYPVPYDRYDPYYRYYLEREAYYARLGPVPGDRGYPSSSSRDRYPPPLPRDRLSDRYTPDPRDRLLLPRSYLDDRARLPPPDPYFRERDPLAARPPPEYYDSWLLGASRNLRNRIDDLRLCSIKQNRDVTAIGIRTTYNTSKTLKSLATGRTEPPGAAASGGSGRGATASGYGSGGDFYRGSDRTVAGLGGTAGSAGGSDYYRSSGAGQSAYGRPGLGGFGKQGDSQSSFAQDPIFF